MYERIKQAFKDFIAYIKRIFSWRKKAKSTESEAPSAATTLTAALIVDTPTDLQSDKAQKNETIQQTATKSLIAKFNDGAISNATKSDPQIKHAHTELKNALPSQAFLSNDFADFKEISSFIASLKLKNNINKLPENKKINIHKDENFKLPNTSWWENDYYTPDSTNEINVFFSKYNTLIILGLEDKYQGIKELKDLLGKFLKDEPLTKEQNIFCACIVSYMSWWLNNKDKNLQQLGITIEYIQDARRVQNTYSQTNTVIDQNPDMTKETEKIAGLYKEILELEIQNKKLGKRL